MSCEQDVTFKGHHSMSDYNNGYARPTVADMSVDAGLRSFMLGVYNKMGLGLLLAGGLAWTVGNVPQLAQLLFQDLGARGIGYTPLGMVVAFAPLAVLLASRFLMRNMTVVSSAALYWVVVSLVGLSLGVLFVVYAGTLIYTALLVTAVAFGGLSLYGYATKRDLSPFGSFLVMAVFGLVASSVALFFLPPAVYNSPIIFFGFNIIGVLVFSGMIAWKTQELKMMYYQLGGNSASTAIVTNIGALSLFISFVNLFQVILALMGGRRN
ncbi:FtsH-binding integral membrane protein [Caulobacter ginsengisoli]|uniref:FtsH-binding integral membrane protein n=1 Tax=Caulobacter ginsengisoli TaxID=400775 RepID=A0ABU0IYD0_9CAUL|nr:Bax inhibitor-1/YccA family protein [Caulobacter ginsengisoli]MDQ0466183.1 FtsH-binding integral membrane protein [Caulobacter ginsengisoli]